MPLLLHDFDSCCSERIYPPIVQVIPSPVIEEQPGQAVDKVVVPALNGGRVIVVWAPEISSPKIRWGATVDILREVCYSFQHPSWSDLRALMGTIETAAMSAAQTSIQSKASLDSVHGSIRVICSGIYKMLAAAQVMEEISDNTAKKIMNAGIQLSCCVFLALLQERQVPCKYIDIGDLVPSGRRITPIPLSHQLWDQIGSDSDTSVTIIAGDTTCFSDGPTKPQRDRYDLRAAHVARDIGAAAVQVYQSRGGVFTANPATVHAAYPVHAIDTAEAYHLAYSDGHILSPMALDQVRDAGIPLRVMGINDSESKGMFVTNKSDLRRDQETTSEAFGASRRVSLIATTHSVYRLRLHWAEAVGDMQFALSLLATITKRGISLDVATVSDVCVSGVFTIADEPASLHVIYKLHEAFHRLDSRVDVDLTPGLAVVKVIGREIHRSQIIQSDMLHALGQSKIQADMVSHGITEHNICYILREESVGAALTILHRWCSQKPEP